jgi:hypothetical protein
VQKNRCTWVPLEITVRNEVPSENIPAGTSFLTGFSKGTKKNIFY